MFNKCKHKFGEVQKDGYQYCLNCGRAIEPLKQKELPCIHKNWEIYDTTEIEAHGLNKGRIIVLKCKDCGDLKKFSYGTKYMDL